MPTRLSLFLFISPFFSRKPSLVKLFSRLGLAIVAIGGGSNVAETEETLGKSMEDHQQLQSCLKSIETWLCEVSFTLILYERRFQGD